MRTLGDYITTIVLALTTLALTCVSDFVLALPREFTWLTFFIGGITTIGITLIERSLIDKVLEKIGSELEIYALLENISRSADDEIALQALDTLDRFKADLTDIKKGILKLDEREFIKHITKKVQSATKSIQTIHIASSNKAVRAWVSNSGLVNYYQANVDAVKRGVRFERVFILERTAFVIGDSNSIAEKDLMEVLARQHADGVHVWIVWKEDVANMEMAEFLIKDKDEEVQINYPLLHGNYCSLKITRLDSDIRNYRSRYEDLKAIGQPFELFRSQYGSSGAQSSST